MAALCTVSDVTEDAVNIMNSTARGNNVTIHNKIETDQVKISFDRNKLLQVFLNLITNAIDACENGGSIFISSYIDEGSGIVWEIEDTGIGISEENKQKILNDFYTSKAKGTGLGLTVCQSILNDHQCELKFESIPGNGTKFFVLINPNLVQR